MPCPNVCLQCTVRFGFVEIKNLFLGLNQQETITFSLIQLPLINFEIVETIVGSPTMLNRNICSTTSKSNPMSPEQI